MNYTVLKLAFGVAATFGLYSVLYRENKFYRFWEHVFLGLAAGWALFTLWSETLKPNWWDRMVGRIAEPGAEAASAEPGYWLWALIIPLALAGYFVYSKKHGWIARLPIGVIIGLWSGQQFSAWLQRYWPQINASMLPLLPTTTDSLVRPYAGPGASPETVAAVAQNVYLTQVIGNVIATITLFSVLMYFLFSFELKSKFLQGTTKLGRYLLMIGFGAIFGNTVMMRFSLLIDRMYFIWIEFVREGLIQGLFRGGGGG